MNGKVGSENTTKGVLCYTSRGVTKHIFLQNTPESVLNLGQAQNTPKGVSLEHTKVCSGNT